jgi:hypothetical protein
LRVDDVNKGAAVFDLTLEVILEDVVAGKIDYVEVNIVVGLDGLRLDLLRGKEEVGLVGC